MSSSATPMMRQYKTFKRKYPDCLIMFRVGDFFELFGDDAKLGARVLGITLTKRAGEPLAGVPAKAVDAYMSTLVKHGYKVVVVDQLEDASEAKGLVKRGVIRILTPGTITESAMLESSENNYIISIYEKGKKYGLALADISTGEFRVTHFVEDDALEELLIELNRIDPKECLVPEKNNLDERIFETLSGVMITNLEDYRFSFDNSYQLLNEHFKTKTLEGFGCEDKPCAISAAGALMDYLMETQKTDLDNIRNMTLYSTKGYMIIDPASYRSLELTKNVRDNSTKGTLVEILDKSCTSLGGRFIRKVLRRPLLNVQTINERLDTVDEFVNNSFAREDLRTILRSIQDLERLASQVSLKRANARDIISIKNSLMVIPNIQKILKSLTSSAVKRINKGLDALIPLVKQIEKAIKENPPITIKEGGIIKDGFNEELDKLRDLSEGGRKWILNYELEEKTKTGIKALRVEYNRVLGYYMQISNNYLNLVPESYILKQEVTNGKRYITPEIKDYETKILNAKDQINDLEYKLFCEVRDAVYNEIAIILNNADKIAELDCLTTFAEVSRNNGYIRPVVNDSLKISITQGRHPVVEKMALDHPFIPNDIFLDNDTEQLLLITGPNMSGKSTYIRQVALIVLMAQIGCFVPAEKAIIGYVDRIFTRIGASDDISKGLSTFLVEMNETANILNNATKRSLLILDEIGRGTSTFDGVSIAWAVAEFIHNSSYLGAKTLFATHYHQLIDLEKYLERVRNYHIDVKKTEDKILFLYKIHKGGTDKSYGIQVAKLSGMPDAVINRAKEILIYLELQTNSETAQVVGDKKSITMGSIQTDLFGQVAGSKEAANLLLSKSIFKQSQRDEIDRINEEIIEELKEMDLENLTPIEAMNKLHSIRQRILKNHEKVK
ncbi:MAG TPA: DNA mismatch repair protein MutS [Candidatus Bathyarchaeia archaeon]|nr:DNA mismatch repair protein MutS [Candidatus Bathyarchaeia archaeon]